MDSQFFINSMIILCSLAGWYVVLHKYLELKAMLRKQNAEHPGEAHIQQHVIDDPVKRQTCNWATVLHLSGYSILSGVIFLNIVIPAIIWLYKKEQHPFLDRQGREVINFQITLTLLQILCLFIGATIVWLLPGAAQAIFEWTKTIRVLFASSMYLPFNVFSALPFFWGCIMILRGAVAAYHGISFKYPLTQPFLGAAPKRMPPASPPSAPTNKTPDPAMRVNFG